MPLVRNLEIQFQIQQLPISFRTAKQLRGLAEMLPPGPQWRCQPWTYPHPTTSPVKLFYRDAIECLESLFGNPLLADVINLAPFRVFKTAEKLTRLYSQWLSGDTAWEMQVSCLSEALHELRQPAFRIRYRLVPPSLAQFCHPIKPQYPL
jgi:hypothetical protein